MKRSFYLTLAMTLAFAFVLAGCSGETKKAVIEEKKPISFKVGTSHN